MFNVVAFISILGSASRSAPAVIRLSNPPEICNTKRGEIFSECSALLIKSLNIDSAQVATFVLLDLYSKRSL